ncbi:hypothetical protein J4434_00980 [Candidatus Woesearchaeota archaeon]|nr:hypothetical protein [Candidatus Woesearchaeota archaeon]
MKFNKKADVAYWQLMFLFVRLFVLTLVMFSLVFLVHVFVDNYTNIQKEEMNLFVEHLIYSKNGLSYADKQTGRSYPGIINYDEVKSPQDIEAKLNKAFSYGNYPLIAAHFEFVSLPILSVWNPELENEEIEALNEFYYNKEKYDEWKYLTGWANKIKVQSAKKLERVVSIVIRKENADGIINYYPAKLKITLLSPSS